MSPAIEVYGGRIALALCGVALGYVARIAVERYRAAKFADESMIPPQYRGSRQLSRAYMRGVSKMAVRHASAVRQLPRRRWWQRLRA